MTPTGNEKGPRYVYDRRYVEPEIQLLLAESDEGPADRQRFCVTNLARYRPTGTRTDTGLYEYELVEESEV